MNILKKNSRIGGGWALKNVQVKSTGKNKENSREMFLMHFKQTV